MRRLASRKYIRTGQLEDRGRVGLFTPVAQIGKRLPHKRVQLDRPPAGIVRQLCLLSLETNLRQQLQCEATNLAKLLRDLVQVPSPQVVIVDQRVLRLGISGMEKCFTGQNSFPYNNVTPARRLTCIVLHSSVRIIKPTNYPHHSTLYSLGCGGTSKQRKGHLSTFAFVVTQFAPYQTKPNQTKRYQLLTASDRRHTWTAGTGTASSGRSSSTAASGPGVSGRPGSSRSPTGTDSPRIPLKNNKQTQLLSGPISVIKHRYLPSAQRRSARKMASW